MRAISRSPCASNRQNWIVSAWREATHTLMPPSASDTPTGCGFPSVGTFARAAIGSGDDRRGSAACPLPDFRQVAGDGDQVLQGLLRIEIEARRIVLEPLDVDA